MTHAASRGSIDTADVPVIVGAGLAGLTVALNLAPRPCIVVSAGPLDGECASGWAQGGIAAALSADDSAERHAADTLRAGGGLCDPAVVRRISAAAPAAVSWLEALGARFDRDLFGGYALGLEGAHDRHRIVHAGGDGSGAEILRAVSAAVRATPTITVLEGVRAARLLTRDGRVSGLSVDDGEHTQQITASQVVLATGGVGGLWAHTTNPLGAQGQGLALAARAGAVLRDLEMVQFHPTALAVGRDPMPLVSEAVRGEGALLVDEHGDPLVDDPLAARDLVARALWQHVSSGQQPYLDARPSLGGGRFADHFPAIAAACAEAGVDPTLDLVPVRPAAHYHCGGVLVDEHGRSTVPGLWACGEVASTGLHGANRLASNSLLEAVVCGREVAASLRLASSAAAAAAASAWTAGVPAGLRPVDGVPPVTPEGFLREVRRNLDSDVGILRDRARVSDLAQRWQRDAADLGPDGMDDARLVALLVVTAASARPQSLGGHQWSCELADHTELDGAAPRHTLVRLDRHGRVGATQAPARAERGQDSRMRASA